MTEAGNAVRARPGFPWLVLVATALAIAALLWLGTWQVQRLQWKQALLASIAERIQSEPEPLGEMERRYAGGGDVEYRPVRMEGRYLHDAERHFFATHQGSSGFYVYTPLQLDDGRIVFVNRGFVPYDRKEASMRSEGQLSGEVDITGLARNSPEEKPSFIVPDNDPAKNIFYWKHLDAMAASAGLPEGAGIVPFFVDADDTPNPGGLPVGGVTMIELPNNHLQYAVTWYGLAAALAAVSGLYVFSRHRGERNREE